QSVKHLFGGKDKTEQAVSSDQSVDQLPPSKSEAREVYATQRNAAAESMTALRGGAAASPAAPADRSDVDRNFTPASEARRSPDVVANTEVARRMLEQGRKAFRDGNLELAARFANAAQARKPDLAFWEDNPERLKRDIERITASRTNAGEVALV